MPLVPVLKPRQWIACRRDRSGGMVIWRTLGVWIACLWGIFWLHALRRKAWLLALHLCILLLESRSEGIATRCVADLLGRSLSLG